MYNFEIAVLIPCYNEALSIAKVISDFKQALPNCKIYVGDNNSTDNTSEIARQSGAIVLREARKGKGNILRRMFSDINSDLYIIVDGDDTYDALAAPVLVETLVNNQLDMVVGVRVENSHESKYKTYRFGHRFGNNLFSSLLGLLFGKEFSDVFSGYRVFSKRFVKSFPGNSRGFEIETELTVHSLELRMPTMEIKTNYKARPEGSFSKLSSYKDGAKILLRILILLKEIKPMLFFGSISLLFFIISILLFYPVFINYLHTGLVPRFPTAILSTGLMIISCMSLVCGVILDSVARGKREIKRLFYLIQQ